MAFKWRNVHFIPLRRLFFESHWPSLILRSLRQEVNFRNSLPTTGSNRASLRNSSAIRGLIRLFRAICGLIRLLSGLP